MPRRPPGVWPPPPRRVGAAAALARDGCSVAPMASRPGRHAAATPLMARLLASVPPPVKITCVGWELTSAATCPARAPVRRGLAAALQPRGDLLHVRAGHEIGQGYPAQELVDALAQVFPQLVRQAGLVAVAVLLAAAAPGVNIFIYGDDDLGHGDLGWVQRQVVAAAGPAHAVHEAAAAQAREQLLEVRQRNPLAFGDGGQRHRALLRPQPQVEQ